MTPSPCTQTTLGVDPATNPDLAADCDILLAVKDTLIGDGSATLNWSADLAISSWEG